ncbi:DUF6541 family protein [Atopobiaceae bacterium 24-176]
MGISFVLAFLLGLAAVVVPGFLVCVSFGLGWHASACVAPGASMFLYFAVSLGLGMLSVDGVLPLGAGVLGAAAAVSAVAGAVRYKTGWHPAIEQPSLRVMALYVAVGSVLFFVLFAKNSGGFGWFLQYNDNSAHLTTIKAMVDGASTSPVRSVMYGSNVLANQSPLPPGTSGFSAPAPFYPSAYHNIAALVLASGVAPIAVVQNAVNAVFTAAVYPLGVCVLLAQVTRGNRKTVFLGSVACGASYAFPLRALVIHQNYPNVVAFCCIPLACALLVAAFPIDDGDDGGGEPAVGVSAAPLSLLLLSLAGLVDLHPNAVIAFALAASCFLMGRVVPAWARTLSRRFTSALLFVGAEVGILVVCLSVWLACLVSPPFVSAVGFLWEWTVPVGDAFAQLALLGLRIPVEQPLLAAVVAVGLVWCVTHRGQGWIALAYGVFAAVFLGNAAGTPTIKRIFAGFFYTDPDRTAALVGLWASIVAAFGLYALFSGVTALLRKAWERKDGHRLSPAVPWIVAVVVCAAFAVGNYGEALAVGSYPKDESRPYLSPSEELPGGAFAWQEWELQWASDSEHALFFRKVDADFMQRVVAITGHDDLILNIPLDGSMYAYPVNDANVFYKRELTGPDSETSQTLRLHLNEYAENPEVQRAVEETGAKYVLQLSAKGPQGANYADYERNRPGDWAGIASITPETPGFELVLSDENMALYRILPPSALPGREAA